MGRQYRAPRRGSGGFSSNSLVAPAIVTSSSTAIAIPNYGITDIGAYAAGEYVLDSPDTAIRKTLLCVSSSSAARVVRMSTGTSVTVGGGAATQITFNATIDQCVVLVGVNSTHWAIETAYPPIAVNATGLAIATS